MSWIQRAGRILIKKQWIHSWQINTRATVPKSIIGYAVRRYYRNKLSLRDVSEMLLQKRHNAKAAIRFLKRVLKRIDILPRVMITDKLRSYRKAHRVLFKSVEHRSHKSLNNRIENSHQPTREKERQMRGFK